MQKLLKTVKGAELTAGASVLIGSLWIFSPSDQVDISNAHVLSGLILVLAPAFLVFVGCYRQTVHREVWAVVLVLIGAVWSFLVFNATHVTDIWGLRVVRAVFCLLFVAGVASCLHTFWDYLNLLTIRNK